MSCSAFNDPSMTGRLSLRSSATCTGASGLALQDILKCNQPNKGSLFSQFRAFLLVRDSPLSDISHMLQL